MTDERNPIDPVGGHAAAMWESFLDEAAAPPLPWPPTGNLVVVAPHPDDEILPTGASLAAASDAGAAISVVAVTDGDASHPHLAPAQIPDLVERRRVESEAAYVAATIEAKRIRLGLPDGDVASHLDQLITDLEHHLPGADLVIAPLPDDGHPDHDAVGAAATTVAQRHNIAIIYVPIWSWNWRTPDDPNLPVANAWTFVFGAELLDRKMAAIACYDSQVNEPQANGLPGLTQSFLDHFERSSEVFFGPA